jgi:predicted GNAT family N-acyltransferase
MIRINIKIADSTPEITAIQAIRKAVYQIEQGVDASLDFDGKDESCDQLIATLDREFVGTARIRYLDQKTAKIERLAVLQIARGQGLGKQLMEKALEVAASKNIPKIVIHAQEYIKGLHQQLGFVEEGDVFEEAGIMHVKMRKTLFSQ